MSNQTTTKLELRTAYGPVFRTVLNTPPRDCTAEEIPIIDLSTISSPSLEKRKELGAEIRAASVNTGFFYIRNHGIEEKVIMDAKKQLLAFFTQPMEKKMIIDADKSLYFNGYKGPRTTNISPGESVDVKESMAFRYDPKYDPVPKPLDATPEEVKPWIRGEDYIWEGTAHLLGFKEEMLAYWAACLTLARKLVRIFALSLDLEEDYFDSKVTYPGADGVLNYYPPSTPEETANNSVALGSHTDLQLFTLLWQDMVGGLQVLNKDGQWIKAKPIEGTIVVNIGDFMMRLCNDIYKSTVHRVYNRSGVERVSMPFFFDITSVCTPLTSPDAVFVFAGKEEASTPRIERDWTSEERVLAIAICGVAILPPSFSRLQRNISTNEKIKPRPETAKMAPKFIPRQRKHKVLAREKEARDSIPAIDSNALEVLPGKAKNEREEKKRLMREDLRRDREKISGKKKKRLEKYIEGKLKKDENRELIGKLAGLEKELNKNENGGIDRSVFLSSRRLGQGKETRREREERERRLGLSVEENKEESEEENGDQGINGGTMFPLTMQVQQRQITAGGGLKRPLELDEEGKPVLKKRKRRGGVKSKFSFQPGPMEELEWEGFSSSSEMDSTSDQDVEKPEPEEEDSEGSQDKDRSESAESESESGSKKSGSEEEEEEDESDEDGSEKQDRSSAFKTWATQQFNEALGYETVSNVQIATETPRIAGFIPRAPERDPLPLELQPTADNSRKAFSVPVTRPPDIQAARLQLPVVAEEQKIMEAIHNNNLVVVYGATGSGKTTQVPQFLFEAGYGSPNSPTTGMIGVTQPRRVAAVSMAKRVSDELGDHGKRVAYQIRFEGTVGADTAIKFMTDGVLLREVAQDIALRKYSAIIIDEAHERSVNTDILIGMLSRVVKLREELALEDPVVKPLKLIIMSATLRISDFTENKTLFSTPPPVLQAEGRQYPVTNHFSRKTNKDYVEEAFRKISKGHRKLPPGGFLVFLTGQNEITHLSKKLKECFRIGQNASGPQVRISGNDAPIEAEDVDFGEFMDDGNDDYDEDEELDIIDDDEFDVGEEADTGPAKMHILPLYSLLPTREQLRVFEPPPDGSRLIVLATNVAETSLTIPGIRYVFDCGRSKERKYDRTTGVQSFEVGWISKASASQRAGRAGRTGPGHCYRLYSSAVYERDFEEFAEPEILRMPIEGVVLQLKAMNLQHVVNFPFPTPPDRQSLASSEKLLTYLSAISPTGQITPVGSTMSIFPLSPRFARILLVGHLHDCLPYTIALVAGLSASDIFIPENQAIPQLAPREEDALFTNALRLEEDARNTIRRAYNKIHTNFRFLDDKSDAIKLLQVVGEFAHEPTESWCQSHFVRYKILKEIGQLRRQITDLLRINIPAFASLKYQDKLPPPSAEQVKALKLMVATGFIDHIAIRADQSPNPPEIQRKTNRAIDVPYLTLVPSNISSNTDSSDSAVYIHPSSLLSHLSAIECPHYIVYSHLQRAAPNPAEPERKIKTRMHALTDISDVQIAALAKGTPLLSYGKPIKDVTKGDRGGKGREVWCIPYLRREGGGGLGWPLKARDEELTVVAFNLPIYHVVLIALASFAILFYILTFVGCISSGTPGIFLEAIEADVSGSSTEIRIAYFGELTIPNLLTYAHHVEQNIYVGTPCFFPGAGIIFAISLILLYPRAYVNNPEKETKELTKLIINSSTIASLWLSTAWAFSGAVSALNVVRAHQQVSDYDRTVTVDTGAALQFLQWVAFVLTFFFSAGITILDITKDMGLFGTGDKDMEGGMDGMDGYDGEGGPPMGMGPDGEFGPEGMEGSEFDPDGPGAMDGEKDGGEFGPEGPGEMDGEMDMDDDMGGEFGPPGGPGELDGEMGEIGPGMGGMGGSMGEMDDGMGDDMDNSMGGPMGGAMPGARGGAMGGRGRGMPGGMSGGRGGAMGGPMLGGRGGRMGMGMGGRGGGMPRGRGGPMGRGMGRQMGRMQKEGGDVMPGPDSPSSMAMGAQEMPGTPVASIPGGGVGMEMPMPDSPLSNYDQPIPQSGGRNPPPSDGSGISPRQMMRPDSPMPETPPGGNVIPRPPGFRQEQRNPGFRQDMTMTTAIPGPGRSIIPPVATQSTPILGREQPISPLSPAGARRGNVQSYNNVSPFTPMSPNAGGNANWSPHTPFTPNKFRVSIGTAVDAEPYY
ncbi:hypothetical protein B7494_g2413 [Chlorociboria aeruginascens]|nr:hypothetical protein B7494_g2413 [Chlorociboria aeruginascens]